MAAKEKGWTLEYTSLKSFTYPMPETRFFHAGVNVYKFKIKYGNTISINTDLDENIISKEIQDAIRVVLGNLDSLCPFTTEHFIIFPYLNKWERVSDLRFMHGDEFLTPYPFVCTIYVELNSCKQNKCEGEGDYRDFYNSTKKRNKFRENIDIERATKQRRLEEILETSHSQHYMNRNLAENAIFMNTSQPNAEFGRTALQKDMMFPVKNQSEETKYSCCSSLISTNGCNVKALGQHTEINRTKNAENYKQERHMLTSQNKSEQRMEMKKKGFLENLKSALFSLFL
ncbi:membrane-anchored junction protein isoform X2 [Pantherophis guttatus]|uniref:Membrane-anchored junction protein isoform X2 n=1 Tax=Pantherophis guttatus TaxID=94885 RepID=A0A6P9BHL4_PANGU|nr:membrane-anchored junction protein isoform X2 [Pantherophis guttatus]